MDINDFLSQKSAQSRRIDLLREAAYLEGLRQREQQYVHEKSLFNDRDTSVSENTARRKLGDSSQEKELGVWVSQFMVNELKLSGTPLLVYALIYSFTNAGEEYWGSRDYLAQRAGCSVSAVDRALRKLEKMGLINERQKAYGRNIYVALPRGS